MPERPSCRRAMPVRDVSAATMLLAACLSTSPAFAEELAGPYPADVVRVIDGDTFEARVRIWLGQDLTVLVRIRDIDAPELHGGCPGEPKAAAAARDHLAALLGSGPVSLVNIRHDKFARRIDAAVRLSSGTDVGAAMLGAGHARASHRGRLSWCPEGEKRQ